MQNKKIILIGFMGSGKTYIGRALAEVLQIQHIDLDYMIEKECMRSIRDIFHTYGEKKFRLLEEEFLLNSPLTGVVSTGGGIITSQTNRKYLEGHFVVWLNPAWDVLYERIKNSNRPLVKRHSKEELYQIFTNRLALYKQVANISIDDIEKDIIIKKIMNFINKLKHNNATKEMQ